MVVMRAGCVRHHYGHMASLCSYLIADLLLRGRNTLKKYWHWLLHFEEEDTNDESV